MTIRSLTITGRLQADQVGANDFGGPGFYPDMHAVIDLVEGTAVNQTDLLWMDERTVSASTNDDIDLAGVLMEATGGSFVAAELVFIFIINKPRSGAANVSNLTIGNATNPIVGMTGAASATIGPIRPNGFFMLGSPDAAGQGPITAGTGDILRVANGSGGSNTYQIAIVARSVA